jgi:hypothetical protein
MGEIVPTSLSVGHIVFNVTTDDNSASLYSFGIYGSTGTLLCSTTAATYTTTGVKTVACSQGTVTIPAGKIYLGMTGNAAVLQISETQSVGTFYAYNNNFATSSGRAQPSSISAPADSWTFTDYHGAIGLAP